MKKKLLLLVTLLMLSNVLIFAQNKKKTVPKSATALQFEEPNHPIGMVKQGTIIEYKFKFKNISKRPVDVKNATATCGCTVPDYPFIPILPGESGEIGVTFNTTHKLGHQKPIVTVTTSAGTYYVAMEGTITD
jgi:hypothetical protein